MMPESILPEDIVNKVAKPKVSRSLKLHTSQFGTAHEAYEAARRTTAAVPEVQEESHQPEELISTPSPVETDKTENLINLVPDSPESITHKDTAVPSLTDLAAAGPGEVHVPTTEAASEPEAQQTQQTESGVSETPTDAPEIDVASSTGAEQLSNDETPAATSDHLFTLGTTRLASEPSDLVVDVQAEQPIQEAQPALEPSAASYLPLTPEELAVGDTLYNKVVKAEATSAEIDQCADLLFRLQFNDVPHVRELTPQDLARYRELSKVVIRVENLYLREDLSDADQEEYLILKSILTSNEVYWLRKVPAELQGRYGIVLPVTEPAQRTETASSGTVIQLEPTAAAQVEEQAQPVEIMSDGVSDAAPVNKEPEAAQTPEEQVDTQASEASRLERQMMLDQTLSSVETAYDAVQRLAREHQDHFAEFSSQYNRIANELADLMARNGEIRSIFQTVELQFDETQAGVRKFGQLVQDVQLSNTVDQYRQAIDNALANPDPQTVAGQLSFLISEYSRRINWVRDGLEQMKPLRHNLAERLQHIAQLTVSRTETLRQLLPSSLVGDLDDFQSRLRLLAGQSDDMASYLAGRDQSVDSELNQAASLFITNLNTLIARAYEQKKPGTGLL